jgi:hypothetical protein
MRHRRETGSRERRLRVLPSRVGIYFVLALGLFPYALGERRRRLVGARRETDRPPMGR